MKPTRLVVVALLVVDFVNIATCERRAAPVCPVNRCTYAPASPKPPQLTGTTYRYSLQCPPNPSRTCAIDLMFLIDSSGSIGAEPFGKAREFLVAVLDGLNIGPNETQVGIIQFSRDAILRTAPFTSSKNDAKKAANDMPYTAGGTLTEKALDLARESFVTHARGENLGIPRVAVLVTDGKPNDEAAAVAAANLLKEKGKGVTVFTVVIIGNEGTDKTKLREMASEPKDQHYYQLADYAELAKSFPKILLNTTCHVSAAISEGTHVTKSVDQCESALFRVAAKRSTGVTLKLSPTQGSAAMYISLTRQEPNEYDNDGHAEADVGQTKEIHVSPAQLKRAGNVSDQSNEKEAEVFIRIVGRAAKNDFVLHVDPGNAIQPPPLIDIPDAAYRNSTKYGRLTGTHNYGDAENACLLHHGSIPSMVDEKNVKYLVSALLTVPELRTTGLTWIFKGDSRHNGAKCHALDICKAKIVERDCSEELVSVCEVPRKGVCDARDEYYFNGHCYKFVSQGANDTEAKQACKALGQGFEVAIVQNDEEIHFAREIADEYAVNVRLANQEGDKTPYGKVEYGHGKYPWCKDNPKCYLPGGGVTLNPSYEGGCFDSQDPAEKHPVLCKHKVAESVGPREARLLRG